MDSNSKMVDNIESIFASGDAWLRAHGAVDNPIFHNNIISNLYMNFPKVKYVEYFLAIEADPPRIRVVMHYSFWTLLFMKKDEVIDSVTDLLRDYLHDYDIVVQFKRFKKGTKDEKVNTPAPSSDPVPVSSPESKP